MGGPFRTSNASSKQVESVAHILTHTLSVAPRFSISVIGDANGERKANPAGFAAGAPRSAVECGEHVPASRDGKQRCQGAALDIGLRRGSFAGNGRHRAKDERNTGGLKPLMMGALFAGLKPRASTVSRRFPASLFIERLPGKIRGRCRRRRELLNAKLALAVSPPSASSCSRHEEDVQIETPG